VKLLSDAILDRPRLPLPTSPQGRKNRVAELGERLFVTEHVIGLNDLRYETQHFLQDNPGDPAARRLLDRINKAIRNTETRTRRLSLDPEVIRGIHEDTATLHFLRRWLHRAAGTPPRKRLITYGGIAAVLGIILLLRYC
jgi:hypothetical protein